MPFAPQIGDRPKSAGKLPQRLGRVRLSWATMLRVMGKAIVAAPFVAILAMMLLGPPVDLVLETIDLVRMRERALATIDAIAIEHGGKGTARADIAYHFSAGGRRIDSHRVLPGYFGNHGTWSGGAGLARGFPVGRQATVYYSGGRPELCALEYGWSCWSVALTLLWTGGATLTASVIHLPAGRWQDLVWYAGWASIVYAFGLLFVGPSVVRVDELPWHAAAWFGALLATAVYCWLRRITPPRAMQTDVNHAVNAPMSVDRP